MPLPTDTSPRPSVFHVGHGQFAAMCIRHAWAGPTVTAEVESDAMADAGEFACPLCLAEWQERQRPVRDGFMRFQALTKAVIAAGLLALLWASPVAAEGILIPETGRLSAPLTLGADVLTAWQWVAVIASGICLGFGLSSLLLAGVLWWAERERTWTR